MNRFDRTGTRELTTHSSLTGTLKQRTNNAVSYLIKGPKGELGLK